MGCIGYMVYVITFLAMEIAVGLGIGFGRGFEEENLISFPPVVEDDGTDFLPKLKLVDPLNTPQAVAAEGEWLELFPQGDLFKYWQKPLGEWVAAHKVFVKEGNPKALDWEPGGGIAVNGPAGKTEHLRTNFDHGDIEAHIEFMVPEASNSGVYFMGRYEIQILDSWGVENPGYGDCGGIYQRWKKDEGGYEGRPPRVNASRAPGAWQTFDVIFHAPRFDEDGEKTANAKFVKVVHNGMVIHENQEVTGPTRSADHEYEPEVSVGPLKLQGDHGPVAYRNIRIRSLNGELKRLGK